MFSMTSMRFCHRESSVICCRVTPGRSGRRSPEQETIMNGKRVIVLGGTSGIGLATAKAAQREGASIVVASSRRQRVDSAVLALRGKAEGEVVDLSDER